MTSPDGPGAGMSEREAPEAAQGTGVSWVKAQDYPHMAKVPDSDRLREQRLAALDPEQRELM